MRAVWEKWREIGQDLVIALADKKMPRGLKMNIWIRMLASKAEGRKHLGSNRDENAQKNQRGKLDRQNK